MLMRIVDPASPVLEAVGYKHLMFAPFVVGSFFSATSVPLIYGFSGPALILKECAAGVLAVAGSALF
jgi:hypothetical protein